jgi:hypothetical protein
LRAQANTELRVAFHMTPEGGTVAGRGPAPKQTRQRRNQPALGDWVRLEALRTPVLPELDDLMPDYTWPAVSRMLWDAWRESPVTQTWAAEDVALAADTILLHAEDPITKASEIRIRIDNLALSPKGRRDARLLLPEEDAPVETPAEPAPLRVLPEAK